MIVKIMLKNTGNDEHPRAVHELFEGVNHVQFYEPCNDEPAAVSMRFVDGSLVKLHLGGNVYVMTDGGKTFDTFEVKPADAAAVDIKAKR